MKKRVGNEPMDVPSSIPRKLSHRLCIFLRVQKFD